MDCLSLIYMVSRPYHKFIKDILEHTQDGHICDLATGTGESVEFVLQYLRSNNVTGNIRVVGTDLFPSHKTLENLKTKYPHFDYIAESVSAFDPPGGENWLYTMFTGFHHFKPTEAVQIIDVCLSRGQSLSVFELGTRNSLPTLLFLPANLILMMLAPFFAKKWRWQKFVFSTLFPLIPIMHTYDGLISNLRIYTKTELQNLAASSSHGAGVKVEYQEKRFSLFFKSYMCRFYLDSLEDA